MKKQKIVISFTIVCAFFAALLLTAFPAYAHFPWVNLTDYNPKKGSTLKFTLGWGHHYPIDGFLKKDEVQTLTIISPNETKQTVEYTSEVELQSGNTLNIDGAYIVAAIRKAGYYTKTAQGGVREPKTGLKNVIRCSYAHMCMKAIASVGKEGKADKVIGHPIEIIALENPARLRAGDYMPIQVLVDGKPYSGNVFATYVGFSTEPNTFAYATSADKKGQARIRILQPGIWLIKVSHEVPYSDISKCDVESYVATLTFAVE
ncbi:MAG: DUF4198 domain-containing protein [Pseudomonadota bacterium]